MGQNKYYTRLKEQRAQWRPAHTPLCVLLCLFLTLFFSCVNEQMLSSNQPSTPDANQTPMYLRVSIPNTYAASSGSTTDDKETVITTLDMLVFERGIGDNDDKYFVKSASEGVLIDPVTSKTRFQVLMPIGEGLRVHLFINCREQLKKKGFFISPGKEMDAMLTQLTIGGSLNADTSTDFPMHGFMNDVNIRKESANTDITIPVLRSAAAAQIMVKATQQGDKFTAGTLPNFDLRSFYVFFQADSGRVAPKTENYEAPKVDNSDTNITRSVKAVSLLENPQVIDVKHPDSVFNDNPVSVLPALYFYENKAWSPTGYDLPNEVNNYATTRLVVGGVYDGMTGDDGTTPKQTYYRIDFAKDDNIIDVLRNNKYIFSLESVSGPGYDTPEQAATGVPINITVNVIEWDNNFGYVLFDRENHFYTATKEVRFPRFQNAERTVDVESNIEARFWKMSFASAANGVTTPSTVDPDGVTVGTTNHTLQNSRYKVEKKETELIFTVLKDYSNLPSGESRSDILVLQAKNLTLRIRLDQLDNSPDDWGDGGNIDSELEGE